MALNSKGRGGCPALAYGRALEGPGRATRAPKGAHRGRPKPELRVVLAHFLVNFRSRNGEEMRELDELFELENYT